MDLSKIADAEKAKVAKLPKSKVRWKKEHWIEFLSQNLDAIKKR